VTNWAQKKQRIDDVANYALERLQGPQRDAFPDFIRRFYKNAPPEDLIKRPVDDLYAAALSLWKYSHKRTPGTAKIRVFNPSLEEHGWQPTHTIIQLCTDDSPFLLDSLTSNLLMGGNELHLLIHPVMGSPRDENGERMLENKSGANMVRESIMYIEINAMTDPDALAALNTQLQKIIADVRAAVEDWQPMLKKLRRSIAELDKTNGNLNAESVSDTIDFLKWLADDHFTFLGHVEFDHRGKKPKVVGKAGLGILRDPDFHVMRGAEGFIPVSPEIQHFLETDNPLLITKANRKSTVHRAVHMDYVGLKKYNDKGQVIGEHRFVGLFTSVSYNRRPQSIPLLKHKIDAIMKKSGFDPRSHDSKALLHILETFPRDELFQMDVESLFETSMGVLHLQERPHCKAFLRPDPFGRYVSALVFVPREKYNSILRTKIETILCNAYNGEVSTRYAQLSNDLIARWHIIIRTQPGSVPEPDHDLLNAQIEAVSRRWGDHLLEVLIDRWGEEIGNNLHRRYQRAFSNAYQEAFDPRFAVTDIEKIENLPTANNIQFNFYRLAEEPDHTLRLKIYTNNQIVALSDCLPMLENMGLRVIEEYAYNVKADGPNAPRCSIHNFYLENPSGDALPLSTMKMPLEEALTAIWTGHVENDGFNKLVMLAGLSSREVVILRAYSKYLRQLGMSFSETYMQDTLTQFADITNALVRLFMLRFDPQQTKEKAREVIVETHRQEILNHLDQVESLDQDRMIRSYLNVIMASLRTNYFQTDDHAQPKPYLAIKIRSRDVLEAPLPKPYAEIFVYAPWVEGVHLRSGPVARGGLRWSDRKEDFRTEVLGLVKAQQVKNALIVPVGAKGGFLPKMLPKTTDREAFIAEGVRSYKTFISGLLDITDNIQDDNTTPPVDVVRHDDDDPYLVVAADKGTATFSDTANDVARAYGFWMDDAFASGGSNGYDHKKMGITARGAWVSVQRHFREMGINVQTDPITVVGVGDMSGDVFGNGMLCSPALRLVAAFDHRDIFIDPNPDPKASYKERKRLFDLPRSSWQDYKSELISEGGGIFSRKAKSITLTPQIRTVLALADDVKNLTPHEVIQAILKASVDLLWFGGIGTYVKARRETNMEVGDRANDALRVNADELNCKVVGEGANLGFTQRARIEFSLTRDGILNTDAVDNSAGVNCSDAEVNIKILLERIVKDGKLTQKQRDTLLSSMTDDVAALVLQNNYQQTQAISLDHAASLKELDSFSRFMDLLVKRDKLNRELEYLPNDDDLTTRVENDQGLTRSEVSVLLAYAKMELRDTLKESSLLQDPYFEKYLVDYFPERLGKDFSDEIKMHPLREEIISTVLTNKAIDHGGICSIHEETGASPVELARAFAIAWDVFDLGALWQQIAALDYKVPSVIQNLLLMDVRDFARLQTIWFVNHVGNKTPIQDVIDRFKPGIEILSKMPTVAQTRHQDSLQNKIAMYCEQCVDTDLATHIASLEMSGAICDIVEVAALSALDVEDVAKTYFKIGDLLGYDWLRAQTEIVHTADHWDRLATAAIIGDLYDQQRIVTAQVIEQSGGQNGLKAVDQWIADSNNHISTRIHNVIQEFQKGGQINVTKLGYATRQMRNMIP